MLVGGGEWCGGERGGERERAALQTDTGEGWAPEGFVAGGFVPDVAAVEKVCEPREEFGAKIPGDTPFGTVRTHTIDHIGLAQKQRLQQGGIVLRIVFEVGVLDQYKLAARVRQSGNDRRPFAPVFCVHYEPYLEQLLAFRKNFAGAIGGAVVDNDDLFRDQGFTDKLDESGDGSSFIEDRNNDGNAAANFSSLLSGIYERKRLCRGTAVGHL